MSADEVAPPAGQPAAGLRLLRTLVDPSALARWTAATGQRALREDAGYAVHAALRATLGEIAPKPFAVLERPSSVQLLGYSGVASPTLREAIDVARMTDPVAARALGFDRADEVVVRDMPHEWPAGRVLSFEARLAPVVRSRGADGTYPEVDAAFHPLYRRQDDDRWAAYGRWLAQELARDGAATLRSQRQLRFALTPIARRYPRRDDAVGEADPAAAGDDVAARTPRRTHRGLLPDLTVRGQLRIDDGAAFARLLARGLGRHRSFGYGCLLLAPAGAWT